ncbi:MAG: hypothetical protein RLZZ234_286 [Candidatus Parcubacteria bacterium]|jgi:hypothetical protein
MNTVNQESKTSAIKTLAILGFIAAIVAGLWLTVQVVRHIPSAFSSLASIANSLYGTDKGLGVTTEKDVVNSGESVRMSYTPARAEGDYTLTYRCVEGIAAETRNESGDIVRFDCNDDITISSGRLVGEQVLDVMFTSEKRRFSDVPYTLAFFKDGADEATLETSGVVTVVNATIPEGATKPSTVVAEEPTPSAKPVPSPTPKPVAVAPKPAAPTPTYIKKVPVTTTAYPVSNPNGFTDLEVSIISANTIEVGEDAVVQIAVKNIGTKTSKGWSFDVAYPGLGDDSYTSKSQAPLLPGERAITTIRFTTTDNDGVETITAKVNTSGDTKIKNNNVSKQVTIRD